MTENFPFLRRLLGGLLILGFANFTGCKCSLTKDQVANPFAGQEIVAPPATRDNVQQTGDFSPPPVLKPYEDGTTSQSTPQLTPYGSTDSKTDPYASLTSSGNADRASSVSAIPYEETPYGSLGQSANTPAPIYLSQDPSAKTIPSVYRTTSLLQSDEPTMLTTDIVNTARQRTTVE